MITILKLHGATCTGCRIAIESYANNIETVGEINIDLSTNQIQLEHELKSDIEEIIDVIRRLGYNASIMQQQI